MRNVDRGGYYYCLLIPLLLWCLFPVVSFNIYFRLICVAFLGMLFLLMLLKNIEGDNYYIRIEVVVVFLLLVYMWVVNWLFSSAEFRLRHLHFSMMLVMSVLAYWFAKSESKAAYIIVFVILVVNIFTLTRTIFALLVDHNVSRYLSKSNEYSEQLAASGIGGYGIVYANVVMLPIFFIAQKVFRKCGNKSMWFLSVANIFLCVIFVFKAQYTIAILLTMISLFMLVYPVIKRNVLVLFPIFIICMFVLVDFISSDASVEYIQAALEGTRYRVKFLDVVAFLETGAYLGDDTVGGRLYAYIKSVVVFIENPLYGSLAFDYHLGAHSDILDKFAQWGAFIGLIVVLAILWFFQVVKKLEGKAFSKEIFVAQFSLFVIAVFNTVAMEIGVSFLLLSGLLIINGQSKNVFKCHSNAYA